MYKKIASIASGARIVRITDAHTVNDLKNALRGGGLFGEKQAVIFEDVCANDEMRAILTPTLSSLCDSEETFFVLEEKPNAELSRTLKKYAHEYVVHSTKKQAEDKTIFALTNALRGKNKKALWIGYQCELLKGVAPEAIHGVLFWGAKDMLLRAQARSAEQCRGAELVALLAELPHEARRSGVELEYALEQFVLSGM